MWESRVCCGISQCGEERWRSRDRTFPRVPPRVISTTKLFSGSCGEPVLVGCCRWFWGWSAGEGGISPFLHIRVERIGEHYATPWPGHALWPPRRRRSIYLEFASVFSLIGGPPRRLHVNNVVRICIDTQIGFLIQRAHVMEMEMCCRASTSLLTKFAAVVNRALQFLPARGHAQVARWVLPVPHSPITTTGFAATG